MEGAAPRPVERVGEGAADDRQRDARRDLEAGDGAQQGARVGMLGAVEDVVHRALLHDPSQVHHDHLTGDLGDDAQVVRDEDDGRPVLALELAQEVQHLRLGRDVDRRRRLVGDEEARLAGQRHGDHRALAEAARELPGVGVQALLGHGDADVAEQLGGDLPGFGPRERRSVRPPLAPVKLDRLDDLVPDRVDRAERGHRLLGNERDLAPRIARISGPRGASRARSTTVVGTSGRNRIWPETIRPGDSTRWRTALIATDFPQPLSPTIPSTWPGKTSKLRPSTARTTPSSMKKDTRRSRTDRRGLDSTRRLGRRGLSGCRGRRHRGGRRRPG